MRDPRRQRNLLLAFALAPAVAAVAAIFEINRHHPSVSLQVLQGVLATVALLLGPMGIIGAIVFHRQARGRERLLAGKGVLGRWTVSPDVWREFLAQEAALATQPERLTNYVTEHPQPLTGPVEIIFGKAELLVGKEFHSLSPSVLQSCYWLDGALPRLGFYFSIPTETDPSEWVLCVPVPPEAAPAARAVYDHHNPAP
jgi:hypothetical protein